MTSQYARGAQREREVQALLERRGWDTTRGAGSKGVDIVACRNGEIMYVEVKATKAGPWSGFGPEDRRIFKEKAWRAGAKAILCWHPFDRQGPRWIESAGWPS